jgi:hypothetical protein
MFTVEMDHDEIEITVLDDGDRFEDVKVFSYDEVVYIRQFNEKKNKWDLIEMTPEMYAELMTAWQTPEGSFITNLSRDI